MLIDFVILNFVSFLKSEINTSLYVQFTIDLTSHISIEKFRCI